MSAGQTASYWQGYRAERDENAYLRRRERERAREAMAASRARAHAHGLSFAELHERVGGERHLLARVLADEERAGRVIHRRTFRRYELVSEAFDADVLAAVRDLRL